VQAELLTAFVSEENQLQVLKIGVMIRRVGFNFKIQMHQGSFILLTWFSEAK
jgi:hypothetical protein